MPTVRTNDIDTYYERRGSGPSIVFVHAAVLDHAQWSPQVEALADEYTTVVYDLRGHGRTGGSSQGRYTIGLFADDLHALISGLSLDRPVVCGLSMGGCIAQLHAATRSDAIAGLVLADTFTPTVYSRREWLQRSVLPRAVVPLVRFVGYERLERMLVWLQQRLHGVGVGGEYGRIEQLRAGGPRLTNPEFAKVIRAFARFHEEPVELAAISVPTLVLYGEHDVPWIRRHETRLRAELPDVVVQELPGAGHAANLDNPDAFTEALRGFLATAGGRE